MEYLGDSICSESPEDILNEVRRYQGGMNGNKWSVGMNEIFPDRGLE